MKSARLPPISENNLNHQPNTSRPSQNQPVELEMSMPSTIKWAYLKAIPSFILSVALMNLVFFAGSGKFSLWGPIIISIVLAVIEAEIKLFISQRRRKQQIFARGNIPTPKNTNLITGDLLDVAFHPINFMVTEAYFKLLGKTFGLFYGPDPVAITIDLDLMQKVFVTDGHKNVDITQIRFPFMTEIGRSLAQVQGDEWRRMRRSLNPSFAHKQMKSDNVFRDIESCCSKLLKSIDGYPIDEASGDGGRIVDVLYDCKKFTMETILKIAFGAEDRVNFEPGSKDHLVEAVMGLIKDGLHPLAKVCVMFDGLQRLFGYFMGFTDVGKCFQQIHSILDGSFVGRRELVKSTGLDNKTTLSPPPRKMIDSLIELIDDGKMDEETLRANLFFIFVAGLDTTSHTLAILFWFLARHVPVQDKLREAIRVEGEEAKYLDWCIRETLRLYPAVPEGVGRILSEDIITSEGQTIFKGTTVVADIYSVHRWQEYWGPDVEQFRPERFSEPLPHPMQYFAFGAGPRNCIGKSLALAEMRAIIARILLKYRVEPCELTPDKILFSAPNFIQLVLDGPINLKFIELTMKH